MWWPEQRQTCSSPELLNVAHSFGELMVLKALQYGQHGCLRGVKAGHDHGCHLGSMCMRVGQMFEFQVSGHGRLCSLQAGLQIRELSRHVQQLQGGKVCVIVNVITEECVYINFKSFFFFFTLTWLTSGTELMA